MKKIMAVTLIVLTFLLGECGGDWNPLTPANEPAAASERPEEAAGDSPAVYAEGNGNNAANGSVAAIQGEWIYYVGSDHYLYAVRADGSEGKRLGDDHVDGEGNIDVAGDRVYYLVWTDSSEETGVFKSIRLDGSDERQLSADVTRHAGNMIVAGNDIYYLNDSVGPIYRMSINGGAEELVVDRRCWVFNIAGGYLYYAGLDGSSSSEGMGLYRVQLDGSGREKLLDGSISNIAVEDSRVYCTRAESGSIVAHEVWSMKMDGTDQKKIYDGRESTSDGSGFGGAMNVADGYVYFQDSFFLWRMKTDGSDKEQLSYYDHWYWFSLVGNYIIFNHVHVHYIMKTDGSDKQTVEVFAGTA